MAIEEIRVKGGVRHTRETQREHRFEKGRCVPPSEIAEVAQRLISHLQQGQVAEELGYPQPRISEAVNGKRLSVALEIIQAYGGEEKPEGPLYFVPSSIDDLAWKRRIEAQDKE